MTERPYGVLTAVCAGNRHLLLIKWAVAPDGLITRLGDSGDEAGALMASNQQTPLFDITAIPIADASACKPVRTASGDLQIDRIGSKLRRRRWPRPSAARYVRPANTTFTTAKAGLNLTRGSSDGQLERSDRKVPLGKHVMRTGRSGRPSVCIPAYVP